MRLIFGIYLCNCTEMQIKQNFFRIKINRVKHKFIPQQQAA